MKRAMALMLFLFLVAGEVCCNATTGSVAQPGCEVRRLEDHTFLRTNLIRCSFFIMGEYIPKR